MSLSLYGAFAGHAVFATTGRQRPASRLIRMACTTPDVWQSLGTPKQELLLSNTLPTGQSFRWRKTAEDTFTGVLGQRVVEIRQLNDDVEYRVLARGPSAPRSGDPAAMRDYFNLDTSLSTLSLEWAQRDERFRCIAPHLPGETPPALLQQLCSVCNLVRCCDDHVGSSNEHRFKASTADWPDLRKLATHFPVCVAPGARMLRQDPVECLFQFICSSNNHINRIHGMVERLCSTYGTQLLSSRQHSMCSGSPCSSSASMLSAGTPPYNSALTLVTTTASAADTLEPFAAPALSTAIQHRTPQPYSPVTVDSTAQDSLAKPMQQQQPNKQQQLAYYAFPTLKQLSAATDAILRADGFGYRAKFIVGAVQQLLQKPEGGANWLLKLRDKPYEAAHAALCTLPGIGPKVAACICLFSLDKHDAIPVDTHVWNLATQYYAPHLANKTLNPKLHGEVQQVLVERFGTYAGWAHNTLFISELASHKQLLPTGLAGSNGSSSRKAAAGKKRSRKSAAAQVAAADVTAAAADVTSSDSVPETTVAAADSKPNIAVRSGAIVQQLSMVASADSVEQLRNRYCSSLVGVDAEAVSAADGVELQQHFPAPVQLATVDIGAAVAIAASEKVQGRRRSSRRRKCSRGYGCAGGAGHSG
eukprot:GHRR01020392.1.p1 GENE.GHRR01020392.1~~GHRR01020392.1.p1  ORF type:complete len:645 (+),score=244.11 GHRR01020392.1:58-1992(+)